MSDVSVLFFQLSFHFLTEGVLWVWVETVSEGQRVLWKRVFPLFSPGGCSSVKVSVSSDQRRSFLRCSRPA